VAALGGSYGGYLANWVAGQTDRFAAIVTHASLWDLDSFIGTTDAAYYWEKEWGDPLRQPKRYEQNSPHRYADAIRTLLEHVVALLERQPTGGLRA
jgi:dipeptidyl aminopeptidase/acylaminoacyl peptidase